MPNGTYGGVRGKETKVDQKTFVSRPIRLSRLKLPLDRGQKNPHNVRVSDEPFFGQQ